MIGVELLGSIYERYLGNTIRVAGRQAHLEAKPEVRKAGGVYYTPKYVVDHIVRKTIGKIIERKTHKQVEQLRFLDPACGSGSFLIGAFQCLIDHHTRWYLEHPQRQKKGRAHRFDFMKDVHTDSDGSNRLSVFRKVQILKNNLFGVDIDPQAVEITMMSLYLKALEGEKSPLPPKQHVLPELKYNIVCGNSLVENDIYDQSTTFDDDEGERINALDWKTAFPEIMAKGKFHAVIANPPYIQLSMKEFRNEKVNAYLLAKYQGSMGRLNTFAFFIEQGKRLTDSEGFLGYIIPNTFLTQGYYEELRRRVLTETSVKQVALLSNLKVFEAAVVENVIVVMQMRPVQLLRPANSFEMVELTVGGEEHSRAHFKQAAVLDNYQHAFPVTLDQGPLPIKAKMQTFRGSFGKLTNINQAIALKYDRAACLTQKQNTTQHKPVLDGRDIDRYFTGTANNFFKFDLSKIHSCKREDIFLVREKIFFRRVGDQIIATLDTAQNYALNTLVVVTPKPGCQWSVRALLGLLNSRLLNFYYAKFLKSSKKVFSEIQARQIAQLPVPELVDSKDAQRVQDRLATLVNRMLDLNRRRRSPQLAQVDIDRLGRDIAATDSDIDAVIFNLYGITKDEQRIVTDDPMFSK